MEDINYCVNRQVKNRKNQTKSTASLSKRRAGKSNDASSVSFLTKRKEVQLLQTKDQQLLQDDPNRVTSGRLTIKQGIFSRAKFSGMVSRGLNKKMQAKAEASLARILKLAHQEPEKRTSDSDASGGSSSPVICDASSDQNSDAGQKLTITQDNIPPKPENEASSSHAATQAVNNKPHQRCKTRFAKPYCVGPAQARLDGKRRTSDKSSSGAGPASDSRGSQIVTPTSPSTQEPQYADFMQQIISKLDNNIRDMSAGRDLKAETIKKLEDIYNKASERRRAAATTNSGHVAGYSSTDTPLRSPATVISRTSACSPTTNTSLVSVSRPHTVSILSSVSSTSTLSSFPLVSSSPAAASSGRCVASVSSNTDDESKQQTGVVSSSSAMPSALDFSIHPEQVICAPKKLFARHEAKLMNPKLVKQVDETFHHPTVKRKKIWVSETEKVRDEELALPSEPKMELSRVTLNSPLPSIQEKSVIADPLLYLKGCTESNNTCNRNDYEELHPRSTQTCQLAVMDKTERRMVRFDDHEMFSSDGSHKHENFDDFKHGISYLDDHQSRKYGKIVRIGHCRDITNRYREMLSSSQPLPDDMLCCYEPRSLALQPVSHDSANPMGLSKPSVDDVLYTMRIDSGHGSQSYQDCARSAFLPFASKKNWSNVRTSSSGSKDLPQSAVVRFPSNLSMPALPASHIPTSTAANTQAHDESHWHDCVCTVTRKSRKPPTVEFGKRESGALVARFPSISSHGNCLASDVCCMSSNSYSSTSAVSCGSFPRSVTDETADSRPQNDYASGTNSTSSYGSSSRADAACSSRNRRSDFMFNLAQENIPEASYDANTKFHVNSSYRADFNDNRVYKNDPATRHFSDGHRGADNGAQASACTRCLCCESHSRTGGLKREQISPAAVCGGNSCTKSEVRRYMAAARPSPDVPTVHESDSSRRRTTRHSDYCSSCASSDCRADYTRGAPPQGSVADVPANARRITTRDAPPQHPPQLHPGATTRDGISFRSCCCRSVMSHSQ
ncbi:uncharacterized protein LOC108665165 isoform X2 [Hyalella azteca]|uniref:Uncharacterized protein LOC108665165 isoform X2 n=1 Tax=Hyalella azteca TaxID=294128 RepID=A0A8B7N1F3_HYAAZ|nr:uncharacterized protein LOC108665165 isoform X2 [Hyalella azteca]